jgi:hypothetical protein
MVILFILCSCGIYTTRPTLEPPYSQTLSEEVLKFTGFNAEDYFLGYVIEYKFTVNKPYKPCAIKEDSDPAPVYRYPTLPRSPMSSAEEIEVLIRNLYAEVDDKSFYDLNRDEGTTVYFSVFAIGTEDARSGRIEYGKWPATAIE